MSRAGRQHSRIHDELGDSANILILAPTMDHLEEEACGSLLDVSAPDETTFLSVSLSDAPDDRLDIWRTYVSPNLPARSGFITAGDQTRSVAATDGGSTASPSGNLRIEAISSPADLTGLGMKMSDLLADLVDEDHQLVVCFHSITTLLQYVDLQKVFRFLHVVTGRLKATNAVTHFHMDPSVHDERELNTITTLYDAVMEPDEDDDWAFRTR